MKKKIMAGMTILCICLMMLGLPVHLQAAQGKTSLAVSAGSVGKGETVKITAQAYGPSGEKMTAAMTVSYDTSVFSFVDCSTSYSGGNGSITATAGTYSITLKAVGEGNSKVSLAATDGVLTDAGTKLDSVEGSSTRIQVGSATTTQSDTSTTTDTKTDQTENKNLSADNSLQSLSLSAGTLSPAFTGKIVQYTASVGNDVTKVTVNAVPANEKATIESITGNENLSVGANTVKVVVKAENGATATYTITVTRGQTGDTSTKSDEPAVITEDPAESTSTTVESTDETITVGDANYQIVSEFGAELLPAGCTESTVSYKGTDYKGATFAAGNLSMLCMVPQGTTDPSSARFFIYDESGDSFYPLIQLKQGDNFVIWLPTPADYTAADGEQQVDITVNGDESMSVHQTASEEGTDFSFFYGVNQDGTTGWYEYDALEQTYQRQHGSASASDDTEQSDDSNLSYLQEEYSTLESEMKKEKSFSRTTIGVLIFIVAVLIIIIINLILRNRGEEYEFEEEEEEPEIKEPKTPVKKTRKRAERDYFSDDLEEEPVIKHEKVREKKKEKKQEDVAEREHFSDELEEPETPVRKEEKNIRKDSAKEEDDIEIIDLNDL